MIAQTRCRSSPKPRLLSAGAASNPVSIIADDRSTAKSNEIRLVSCRASACRGRHLLELSTPAQRQTARRGQFPMWQFHLRRVFDATSITITTRRVPPAHIGSPATMPTKRYMVVDARRESPHAGARPSLGRRSDADACGQCHATGPPNGPHRHVGRR